MSKPTLVFDVPHLPYFTELVLAHDWPPGWLPHGDAAATDAHAHATEMRGATDKKRGRPRNLPDVRVPRT